MEIKEKRGVYRGEETLRLVRTIEPDSSRNREKKRAILVREVGSARDSSLRTRATSVYRARPLECNDWPESLQIRLDSRTSLRAFTTRIIRK